MKTQRAVSARCASNASGPFRSYLVAGRSDRVALINLRHSDGWGHPDTEANAINFRGNVIKGSFKALADRKIRERCRHERQLAEHRTTKHQLQARSSCVADARSYRVARRLSAPTAAQFDWKRLIPVERLKKIRSACFKKFRDHPFERWLSAR
jgi:hypothetical protein